MDDKFKRVSYEEFEPDLDKQAVIDLYVEGKPWLLLSASASDDGGLVINFEAGGGLTYELIEKMIEKSLAGFRQAQQIL